MIRRALAAIALVWLAAPALASVEIQQVTSPGGIKAWLVEDHSIPFVAMEIRFKGGTSLDPPGKRGVTNLMTGLLEEGAGDMDSQAFAAARDGLAASFRFNAHDDALSVSARFLDENRDQALALLHEALVNPRFSPAAVERVRGQVIASIQSDAKDPNAIAAQTFDRMVFGDHPYGTSSDGTIESVSALTRDDIVGAHEAVMVRDRVFVGVAGSISAEDLGRLVDRLLGDLPAEGAALPGPAKVTLSRGVTVVPFDTPQSVAIFGNEGIPRDDPDFFAAYIANEILGGSGQKSRLSNEVRERRGLTYGIGTFLLDYDSADLVEGQFASANDKMGEAIGIVQDQWAKIAAGGVTQEELDAAKTYLTGAYPLRFDGNAPIARILVGMQMIGLTPDYIVHRNDKVNAVTLEDVRRVARRLYRPGQLRFVVVGRPDGVENVN